MNASMEGFSSSKVLFLAANPKNSSKLRLGEEVREIDEFRMRSNHREKFELISKWAVKPRDFHRHMLDIKPAIVHFSGHGTGEDGIVLEDDNGKVQLVPTHALNSLFQLFSNKGLHCVVLNACFSEVQATVINQHIPYVIGMSQGIEDKAAIAFSIGFYDALGAGESFDFAYDLGCAAIHMESLPDSSIPVLKKKIDSQTNSLLEKTNPSKQKSTGKHYRRLERERSSLQQTQDIYKRKLLSLQNARAIETEAAIKFKLDMQIVETEKEISKLDSKVNLIEQQLK